MSLLRRLLIFLIALGLLIGSLVAGFAVREERATRLRGIVDPLDDFALPYRQPLPGINVDLRQYNAEELTRTLEALNAHGYIWLRQTVSWAEIEPQPGVFEWDQVDAITQALAAYPTLRLVVVLNNAPGWARTNTNDSAPPDEPATFARFASAFSTRYGALIDHYQIWDEPNLAARWGEMPPRPPEYVALLSAGYEAIHAGDADATVLAAGLAPTTEINERNISDVEYLRQLFALGGGDYMDGAAGKAFAFSESAETRDIASKNLNFARPVLLREVMVSAGYAHLPLWISGGGWNVLPPGWTGEPSIWGGANSEDWTDLLTGAYARARDEWTWLGGMILQWWQPTLAEDDARWGFSITDVQGNLRTSLPNWTAPSTAAIPGLYPAANPYATYGGVWTFGDLGADIGWVNDSAFSFAFAGDGVALLLREGAYNAYLYAGVDGQPAPLLPRDTEGRAFINLNSGEEMTRVRLVPLMNNMAAMAASARPLHQLDVVADQGWDQWALVGFAVSTPYPAAQLDQQISAAWVVSAIAFAAVVVSGLTVPWQRVFAPFRGVWRRLGEAAQLAFTLLTSLALLIGMLLTWGEATPQIFRREPVQLGAAVLTAGLLYLSPSIVLSAAAILALFAIFYHRPLWGIGFTLLFTPFYLFPVELYRFAFPMSELLIGITAGAALVRGLGDVTRARRSGARPAFPLRLNAFDGLIVVYLLLGVLALFISTYRNAAATEFRVLFIEPAVFYLVLRLCRPSQGDWLLLTDLLIAGAVLVCTIGLFQYVRGEAIITAEAGAGRLASVYGSPNNVALFLERALPFALSFALLPFDARRRYAAAGATLLLLFTCALTQSAGALFFGIPAAILAVLFTRFGRRAWWSLLGIAALGGAAWLLAQTSARFARLFSLTEGTNFFRLRVWQSAWAMVRDHPLSGIGLDQFLYFYRGEYLLPDAWQEPNLSHPHNLLLDHWLRLGILGVVWAIAVQAVFWRALLSQLRTVQLLAERALLIGAAGGMAAVVAHGLVDNSIFVQDLIYVFAFLLALVSGLQTAGAERMQKVALSRPKEDRTSNLLTQN